MPSKRFQLPLLVYQIKIKGMYMTKWVIVRILRQTTIEETTGDIKKRNMWIHLIYSSSLCMDLDIEDKLNEDIIITIILRIRTDRQQVS